MPSRTGTAQLPLHTGKAPPWLFSRMVRLSREISTHIVAEFGPDDSGPLVRASRVSAKVDSRWCVVQQGMNEDNGMARRYHWLSSSLRSYVNEPHAAICAEAPAETLNLVASESQPVRIASAALAREKPAVVRLVRYGEERVRRRLEGRTGG